MYKMSGTSHYLRLGYGQFFRETDFSFSNQQINIELYTHLYQACIYKQPTAWSIVIMSLLK